MKIVKNSFRILLLITMSIGSYSSGIPAKKNILTKAVLHHADVPLVSIERGNLILYFEKEPLIKLIDKENGNLVFLFPEVVASSPEIARMLDELHATKTRHYKVQIAKKGPDSIQLQVQYDPKQTTVSYDIFDTITLQKGVIFRFYNRPMIKKLQSVQKPALLVASNQSYPRVAIDCGHGGSDNGATSSAGLKEKDLCLKIGNKVATLLRERGVETYLTRTADADCSFAQRTGTAHDHTVNALVSIHANHAPNKNAHGIETFYGTWPGITPLFSLLTIDEQDMALMWHTYQTDRTKYLAFHVHQSLLHTVAPLQTAFYDRSVKTAGSQLLLGSLVPAVLVEVGFLSNEHEATALATDNYQHCIAQGITEGVLSFLL